MKVSRTLGMVGIGMVLAGAFLLAVGIGSGAAILLGITLIGCGLVARILERS